MWVDIHYTGQVPTDPASACVLEQPVVQQVEVYRTGDVEMQISVYSARTVTVGSVDSLGSVDPLWGGDVLS